MIGGIINIKSTKVCNKCDKSKPLSQFYPDASQEDGHTTWCIECCRERHRKHLQQIESPQYLHSDYKICKVCGREKPLIEFPKNSDTGERLDMCTMCKSSRGAKHRVYSLKSAAKRRNYIWDISDDYVLELIKKPCEYCGDNSKLNGLDRIDNNLGYVSGNVVSCCEYCNLMKNDKSLDEFLNKVEQIYIHSVI